MAVSAQQKFSAVPVEKIFFKSLSTHFSNYSLFSINTAEIKQHAKMQQGSNIDFDLQLPGYGNWHLSIHENDILSKDYFLSITSANGKTIQAKPECMTYAGLLKNENNSRVSLTLTDDLIYGMIRSNSKEYFIEPLNYFNKGDASGIYVVYETKDVLFDPALTCGVTEMRTEQQKLYPPGNPDNAGVNCVQNELAIASDASMLARYGSVSAVQAHNIGVINNVIWDYVNAQFNNNIEIVIVTQNVSAIAANDQLTPAYTGTNSNTILTNFTAWGQGGGFGAVSYDDAEFWTTRNIDADGIGGNNGIIGLAFVGVICTTNRYHILEDFGSSNPTGSGYQLRVLTTHEMGHNFSASHDAAGSSFIMAPSVQNTSVWSAASISSVDGHVGTRVCLAQCSTAGAPLANFKSTPGAICTGGTFQFADESLHGPTSWSWTFTGGTPATSTSRNPTTSFATNGLKNVSLTSTNGAGSNTKNKLFLVSNLPTTACINTGTGTSNAGINSFNLASINKSTAGLATDGKYQDFSCTDNTMLFANTTYTVNVNVGTSVPANEFNLVQLFIDYNNDGDFIDAGEAVYSSPSCYIGQHTFTFVTPASPLVLNQLLRLRVIAKDCIGGVNSCYNVTAGQVEDYAVFFPNAVLLPVTLMSFDGYHQSGKNFLIWKTSSEVNSEYFEMERSLNGVIFDKIGRVNSLHNSTATARYDFTDNLLNMSAHHRFYYRLKMVDRDGNFKYSNIVTLNSDQAKGQISIYPNPIKKGEIFQLNLQGAKAQQIDIFNTVGQLVYSRQQGLLQGNVSILSSKQWASGQYLVRIMEDQKVTTIKIMIL